MCRSNSHFLKDPNLLQANQRQLAVQAASSLLEAEGIFGFGWLAGGGAETGAQMTTPIARAQTAPLGLVGLAVLVQRCCDKQALVRAKALQVVMTIFVSLSSPSLSAFRLLNANRPRRA